MKLVKKTDRPKRDRSEGYRLQRKANAMLKNGDIGEEYKAIREAAEHHLGFWDWQYKVKPWERAEASESITYPTACLSIARRECPYLPAGSQNCKKNDCPRAK